MKKVRLVADAREEFLKEVACYEGKRAGLGRRFRVAAEEALKKAGQAPWLGKPGVAETRRILVKGFPFAVVCISNDTEVVVYAVCHLSRAPGYWNARLPGDDPAI